MGGSGELWTEEWNGDLASFPTGPLVQIVKIDKDYYLTDSYYPKEWKKNIKKADKSNYKKLEIYKNLYLMDNEGNIYGYDLAKKKQVLIDKDLNIIKYYYEYHD